ncbi:hypothetical protein H6G62_05435 [Phormidium sp. FACHB-1136]|nr:hypothetical protein [Phormidium sp. FACHB-1136]
MSASTINVVFAMMYRVARVALGGFLQHFSELFFSLRCFRSCLPFKV